MNILLIASTVLALLGAFFVFVAGVGVWRFQDVYMRMHAATKAGSLGLGLLLAAVALRDPSPTMLIKCSAIIGFIFLTAPIAAHMISRAAYIHKAALCPGTKSDALKGKYSQNHSDLKS